MDAICEHLFHIKTINDSLLGNVTITNGIQAADIVQVNDTQQVHVLSQVRILSLSKLNQSILHLVRTDGGYRYTGYLDHIMKCSIQEFVTCNEL